MKKRLHAQLAKVGLDPSDLIEAKPDLFTTLFNETYDPEKQSALLLGHLEPVFTDFIANRTVKEFGMGEARVRGKLGGHPLNIRMDIAYFAELELRVGHEDLQLELVARDRYRDYVGETEVRHELGDDVFLSADSDEELARERASWERLSAEVRTRVLETFRASEALTLRFRADKVSLGEPQLMDMNIGIERQRDPRERMTSIFRALQAAGEAVDSLGAGGQGSQGV